MGFFFCSFLNRLKQELIKLILIMSLENDCYWYIISTTSLQEFAQETLPIFQGQF